MIDMGIYQISDALVLYLISSLDYRCRIALGIHCPDDGISVYPIPYLHRNCISSPRVDRGGRRIDFFALLNLSNIAYYC